MTTNYSYLKEEWAKKDRKREPMKGSHGPPSQYLSRFKIILNPTNSIISQNHGKENNFFLTNRE